MGNGVPGKPGHHIAVDALAERIVKLQARLDDAEEVCRAVGQMKACVDAEPYDSIAACKAELYVNRTYDAYLAGEKETDDD